MALLSDLINLNLSDTTKKVIAEYIWWAPLYLLLFFLFCFLDVFLRVSICLYVCLVCLLLGMLMTRAYFAFCVFFLVIGHRGYEISFLLGLYLLYFLSSYWGDGEKEKVISYLNTLIPQVSSCCISIFCFWITLPLWYSSLDQYVLFWYNLSFNFYYSMELLFLCSLGLSLFEKNSI